MRRPSRRLAALLASAALLALAEPSARADEPADDEPAGDAQAGDAQAGDELGGDADVLSEEDMRIYQKLSEERGSYARVLLGLAAGRGFRFNNPYRLRTQLGDRAESVSLTAPYFDASLGSTFGDPDGVQHGAVVHLSLALRGVSQQALSLSYLALLRGGSPLMGYARLGSALLTQPDLNVGGELALGLSYFVTGGLGINAEAVGNLFYGAGTSEAKYTVIPILSLQAGVMLDWEVLP